MCRYYCFLWRFGNTAQLSLPVFELLLHLNVVHSLCGFLRVSSWRIACATTLIDRYASRKAAQVLHGGGTFSNSGNRWFDKTLQVGMRMWMARDGLFRAADAECWLVSVFEQFVVGEDGSWGLLYEQATAEGPPVATLLDHVIEYWWDVGMKLQMCWISQEKLSWGGEWWGVCSECLRFFSCLQWETGHKEGAAAPATNAQEALLSHRPRNQEGHRARQAEPRHVSSPLFFSFFFKLKLWAELCSALTSPHTISCMFVFALKSDRGGENLL